MLKFLNLACKFGMKTAIDNQILIIENWWMRGNITWRNPRLWKMWWRNTDIYPSLYFIILSLGFITVIAFLIIQSEINTYQHIYFKPQTIKRLIISEVSAKELPIAVQKEKSEKPILTTQAVITAYNATPGQTDSTPNIMASGKTIYLGAVACPRKYPFGTRIEILGKIYTCEDRLAKKFDDRFDILMATNEEAINFGKQYLEVKIIE